jgi:hypothetical protein
MKVFLPMRSCILWVTNMYDIVFILKNYRTPKALTNIKAHAKNMVFNLLLLKKMLTFSKGCRTLGGGKDPLRRVHSNTRTCLLNLMPFCEIVRSRIQT